MSKLPEVSETDFESKVAQSKVPVLVDFSAEWCGPCKQLAPSIETLASEYAGKVAMYQVDIDRSPGLAARFDVTAVPTVVLFRAGGQVSESLVGASPKKVYAQKIDALLR